MTKSLQNQPEPGRRELQISKRDLCLRGVVISRAHSLPIHEISFQKPGQILTYLQFYDVEG